MKKILRIIFFTLMIVGISIGISFGITTKISKETIAKISQNLASIKATCSPSTIRVVEEIKVDSDLWRPYGQNEEEIYCIEPGARLKPSGLSKEQVYKYNGKKYSASCGCASAPYVFSDPYYYCTGVHYTESYSGIVNPGTENEQYVNSLYDVGYIASFFAEGVPSWSGNEWSGGKQQAIWMSPISQKRDPGRGAYRASGEQIRLESIWYKEFYDKIAQKDENGKTGIKPKDTTEHDKVKLDTDKTTQTHILGPFKVDYISGNDYGYGFGGISNMYLIDEDGRKIEITNLIRPEQSTNLSEYGDKNYGKPNYFSTIDEVNKFQNANKVDYYDSWRNYPDPNEPFYVEFNYTGEDTSSLKLHIDFEYLKATATVCVREGVYYETRERHSHSSHSHCNTGGCTPCYSCIITLYIGTGKSQNLVYIVEAKRELIKESIEIPVNDKPFEKTMKLGGYVFEDTPQTKETEVNGVKDQGDVVVPGAKVTLYEIDENGNYKLAILAKLKDENPLATDAEINDPSDYTRRINPTLTDSKGYYEFRGLDTEKEYFVMFTYNGQTYLPTEYLSNKMEEYNSVSEMVSANKYDTAGTTSEIWRTTSKAQEVASQRVEFDKRFEEIRSYPENYKSTNSLKISEVTSNNGYNITFSQYDLMGFDLQEDGTYKQVHNALIDSYLSIDSKGNIVEGTLNGEQINKKINEGLITKKLREFINKNKRYPTDDEMKSQIYQSIVNELAGSVEGGASQVWRMLQFIEDCKINAYTISNPENATSYDIYPVYDKFTTYVSSGNKYPNNSYSNGTHDANASTYEDHIIRKNNDYITLKNIYQGQLFVNCGLWRRQELDAALRKDVYKAALKINDKTVVYNYDKRKVEDEGANSGDGKDNNTYWDINVRMSDYNAYYGMNYNREIYDTDYIFNTSGGLGEGHPGDPLEIYITYKITIRNQSMSILGQIKEVVDYYDKDYTYKPNLSWVIYQTEENKTTSINKDEYYSMMEQQQEVIDAENTSATKFITNSKDAKVDETNSKYGSSTHSDITKGDSQYNALYVQGLEDKKLATGESAYIYLTFEVNKDSSGRVILDEESSPKENLAEINGYKTYYKDGTQLPNGVQKGSNDIAGLIDRDSNPGNLVAEDLKGDKYEKNFEDDTDRAPSLRVLIDKDAVRKANGTVWEDERNKEVEGSIIGDGIRDEDEIGVQGVTVQLVEKGVDDTGKQYEYIWQEVTTSDIGQYEFKNYIPGDYVIRFYYGDTEKTALISGNNETSYNGQDFKSTIYQEGIEQNGTTDTSGRYQGYTHTDTQNVSGNANPKKRKNEQINPDNTTYGYDIYKADSNPTNYSDAKDIWSTENRAGLNIIGPVQSARLIQGRSDVIDYSDNDVTNHVAEVLASPYQRPSYNGTEYSEDDMNKLYEELMNETYMTAETGVIVVEFEYDRQQTDGLNSTQNKEDNKNYVGDNAYNSNFTLNNIDFGLVERPKAQLEIDKSVANVKVTLANGSILFDINKAANNAIWKDHEEYSIDEGKKSNGMYEEYYKKDHRYAYRTEIDKIVKNTDRGLIQLTMDEELMHGATIQIEYTVKITNVGEIDYVDDATKDFYYNGDKSGTTVVTTTTNQVVDYVQNNLQFVNNAGNINDINTNYIANTNQQNGWNVIKPNDITGGDLVNNRLAEKLPKFNTIIQTGNFATDALVPGQETSRTLILTQMITPENEEDDLTYSNMVEIVKTSNTVGRRMAYSVVGNQDPLANDPAEVDTSMAEKIVILPPFGEVRMYYILGAIIAILLIGGIVLIKKKVLKGKD